MVVVEREHEAELVDPRLARRAQLDDAVRLLPGAAGPAARRARRRSTPSITLRVASLPCRRVARREYGPRGRTAAEITACERVVCGDGLGGEVGGALEHLERLVLAAGTSQELAPGPVGLDVVAAVALLLEQRGRLAEGRRARASVSPVSARPSASAQSAFPRSCGILVADGFERRSCPADRLVAVAELHRAPAPGRCRGSRRRSGSGFGPKSCSARSKLRPASSARPCAIRMLAAEQVRTREVERVVGDVEQRDRAANVVERGGRAALKVVQPGEATSRAARASRRPSARLPSSSAASSTACARSRSPRSVSAKLR